MIDRLALALDQTAEILHGTGPDQWSAPTPCAGWDVWTEANHLVGGLRIFAAQLSGDHTEHDHDGTDWLGEDPAAAFDMAARADLAAWSRPESMDAVLDLAVGPVPAQLGLVIHVTEVLVHGVDLAVATGQEGLVDTELASWLLELMRGMGTESFRAPGIFEAERPVPAGTPAHRELLAYLGRDLTAVPA